MCKVTYNSCFFFKNWYICRVVAAKKNEKQNLEFYNEGYIIKRGGGS